MSDSNEIDLGAGTYKCERAISLEVCYVIAKTKSHSASAVFARHERDLDVKIKRRLFDVGIRFLEDLETKPRAIL